VLITDRREKERERAQIKVIDARGNEIKRKKEGRGKRGDGSWARFTYFPIKP